jgi:hypothetical protein
MTPTYLVENTLNPTQFAAATSAVVATGAATSKGGNIWQILILGFLALALGYMAWRYYEDSREEVVHPD